MRNGPSALPTDDNYLCWQRIGRMWGNDQTSLVGDERNTRRFHSQKTVTQNEGWELYDRIPYFQDTVDREG